MATTYLVDTDILIDYLRGDLKAVQFLEDHLSACSISVLTVTELFSGAKLSRQIRHVEVLIQVFKLFSMDLDISRQAGLFRGKYGASHGTGVVDAILAATAEKHGLCLVSRNKKHFPMVTDLLVPY